MTTSKTIYDYLDEKEQLKLCQIKRPRIEKGVDVICKGNKKVVLQQSHPFLQEKAFKNLMKLKNEKDNMIFIQDMTKEDLDIICTCYDIKKKELTSVFHDTIMEKIVNEQNNLLSSQNRDKLNKLYIVCHKYLLDFICDPLISAWAHVISVHTMSFSNISKAFRLKDTKVFFFI